MALTRDQLLKQLADDGVSVTVEILNAAMKTGNFTAKSIQESKDEYEKLKSQLTAIAPVTPLPNQLDTVQPSNGIQPRSIQQIQTTAADGSQSVQIDTQDGLNRSENNLGQRYNDAVENKAQNALYAARSFPYAVTDRTAQLINDHREEIAGSYDAMNDALAGMIFGGN